MFAKKLLKAYVSELPWRSVHKVAPYNDLLRCGPMSNKLICHVVKCLRSRRYTSATSYGLR